MSATIKGKGTLLLFLSDFKEPSETLAMYPIENKEYEGRQTNEAPSRYLIECAQDEGYPIDTVLCISSDKVRNELVLGHKTAYDVFSERIGSIMGWDDPKEHFIQIEYNEQSDNDIALPTYQELNKHLSGDDESRVYIDYTGGFRDVSFLMTTVVRFLEIKGVKTSHVAYAVYHDPKRIVDITYIYQIMRLINGVDEFASTGSARALSDFTDDMNLDRANRLMTVISHLADNISLCQVEDIDVDFDLVNKALKDFADGIEKEAVGNPEKLYLSMLKEMIPVVRKKMYLDDEVSIPNIIRWCIDNGLVQQAITFYVEKMPKHYYQRGIISAPGGSRLSDAKYFYEHIYDDLLSLKEKDSRENQLKKIIQEIVQEIEDRNEGGDNNPLGEAFWKKLKNRYEGFETEIDRIRGVYKEKYRLENEVSIYGERVAQKNPLRFFNSAGISHRYLHYFLYNDQKSYEVEQAQEKQIRTYRKKWDATVILDASDGIDENYYSNLGNHKIAEVLRFYLATKMIRNTLNHASGAEEQVDASFEETRQLLCKEAGIIVDESMDKRKIRDLLRKGVNLTENQEERHE